MSCESYREILSAMLDGEATPDEVEACAVHVETCTACADYRDGLEADRKALRAWPHEPLPSPRSAGIDPRRWLAVAAALVLAFVAGRVTASRPELAAVAAPATAVFLETRRTVYPDTNEIHSFVTLRTSPGMAAEQGGQ